MPFPSPRLASWSKRTVRCNSGSALAGQTGWEGSLGSRVAGLLSRLSLGQPRPGVSAPGPHWQALGSSWAAALCSRARRGRREASTDRSRACFLIIIFSTQRIIQKFMQGDRNPGDSKGILGAEQLLPGQGEQSQSPSHLRRKWSPT